MSHMPCARPCSVPPRTRSCARMAAAPAIWMSRSDMAEARRVGAAEGRDLHGRHGRTGHGRGAARGCWCEEGIDKGPHEHVGGWRGSEAPR